MTMILKGKYTDAIIIANTIESGVIKQTLDICNHPIFKDCPIRIMPDCHEGKGCVIGFTSPMPENGEIIPNIIGVDQSCFTGDTKVALADGRSLSFLDLIEEYNKGKTNYCYCIDSNESIQISKIELPRKIKTVNKLCHITLDNKKVIKCTLDHKFYTISGELCQAKDLKVGQALFPLYTDLPCNVDSELINKRFLNETVDKHLIVFQPKTKRYDYAHILADAYNERTNPEIKNQTYDGKKSFLRHHIDFNSYNNNPDNIQRVGYKEHYLIHAKCIKLTNSLGITGVTKAALKDPLFYSKAGKLGAKATFDNSRNGLRNRELSRKKLLDWNKTEARKILDERTRERQKINNTTKFSVQNKDPNFISLQKQAKLTKILDKCIELYGSITEINYNKTRQLLSSNTYTYSTALSIAENLGKSLNDLVTYKNHKVVSIHIVDAQEDVYCLTNFEYGNFALEAGVFVKNCGVVAAQLPPDIEIDFNSLDKVIRTYIPSGINGRKTIANGIPDKLRSEIERYNKDCLKRDATDDLLKLGSLGGGNHFISVEKGQTGTYLIIHSGSRNFGNEMARYFQKIAMDTNLYSMKELSYLSGKDAEDYMNCAKTCYFYGQFSRGVMIREICKHMNFYIHELIETVHNYIGDDNIIRKGAIACHKDANAIIPLNMRDGSLLINGKGNQHWNFSGPHGAGRILSRSKAKEQLKLEDYQEAMKGIYSSCISNSTLDEAPMAYKNGEEIKDLIEPTAEVYDHLIPVYNFKAS